MEKKYPSKIGAELVIPLVIVMGGSALLMLIPTITWIGLCLVLAISIYLLYMFKNTFYLLKEETLYVKCGFYTYAKIPVPHIRKVEETRNWISGPATSIDRLEITYNRWDHVLISPKNKKEFINDLLALHPAIEIANRSKP